MEFLKPCPRCVETSRFTAERSLVGPKARVVGVLPRPPFSLSGGEHNKSVRQAT
jgi:hypothetical protein